MKYFRAMLPVAIFLVILQPLYGQTKNAPTSAEQLLKRFKVAVTEKDKDALMELVNWQGVSKEMKAQLQELFKPVFEMEAKDISLDPLPENYKGGTEHNGIRYRPNVDVVGYISVKLVGKNLSMTPRYPYGKKNGAFYLAGVIEERVSYPATKEKGFNISVMGLTWPKKVSFTGTCVYMRGGQEYKKDISGDQGNISIAFGADYIKSCKVQKISDFGTIQLIIYEDGKEIFKSEKIETNDPIIYEKK
jgi:hypothetical protein